MSVSVCFQESWLSETCSTHFVCSGIVELFETLTREDESLSNDSLLESVSQYDDPDAYVGGNAIPTAIYRSKLNYTIFIIDIPKQLWIATFTYQ